MRKINIGMVVLVVLFALFIFISLNAPKEIDWGTNYTSASSIPHGGQVMYRFLDNMNGGKVERLEVPAYTQLNNHDFRETNYVFFNSSFDPDKYDIEELLRYAKAGNTIFVSAYAFSREFADTLGFRSADVVYSNLEYDTTGMSVQQAVAMGSEQRVRLVNPNLANGREFVFKKLAENVAIEAFDTATTTVLGKNLEGKPNFIRVAYGKGSIFVHTFPDAFINYHLADSATAPYAFGALSYLRRGAIFLDDYYKDGYKMRDADSRRVLLADEALRAAYLITVVALILGIIFGAKRRQRIIPVVKPLQNTTLEFVEVVGTLYYQQHNTYDIVQKKITYFLESVRTRFFVKTVMFDGAFVKKVAALSGVDEQEVGQLFSEIARLQQYGATDADLKRIEELMWDFNQKSKR